MARVCLVALFKTSRVGCGVLSLQLMMGTQMERRMRTKVITLFTILLAGVLHPQGALIASAEPAVSAAQIEYLVGVSGMT